MATIKEQLGCWLNERWKTELILTVPKFAEAMGLTWLDLCNRSEVLQPDPVTGGRICQWQFSSRLTVTRFFPKVGGRLLNHCLVGWPINLEDCKSFKLNPKPKISIIVGVRGKERLPQFFACLTSLQNQEDVDFEIIVVEQSWQSEFSELLTSGVRYIHQQCASPDIPYNRSWAFNLGVKQAKGKYVVLHDADMLVPQTFARSITNILDSGIDGVRLPRLIFYLDQSTSEFVQTQKTLPVRFAISEVVANNRTPVATTKDAYLAIGGHDEAFWGWGGEDDEFMDRLRTLNISEGGYLPIIHLWHPSAPKKANGDRNSQLCNDRLRIPTKDRINELKGRAWGEYIVSVEII
jgi:GT2 family glycosyltransferase